MVDSFYLERGAAAKRPCCYGPHMPLHVEEMAASASATAQEWVVEGWVPICAWISRLYVFLRIELNNMERAK